MGAKLTGPGIAASISSQPSASPNASDETVVHVQLLVAVEERQSRVIGDKIDLGLPCIIL